MRRIRFAIVLLALMLSAGVWSFIGQRTRQDPRLFFGTCGEAEVAVFKKEQSLDYSYYYYTVRTSRDGTERGPFYIGVALFSPPSFALHQLTDHEWCLYNMGNPDDVYCYLDFGADEYYPSVNSRLSSEKLNGIIATRFRPTATLTDQFSGP